MLGGQVGELPVATVRRAPGASAELLVSDLKRWLTARWRWFRPRTIPVTVAFVGMLGMLQAVNYLSTPPATHAQTTTMSGAIFIDGKPYKDGSRIPDLESSGYRVRLVLQQ